MTAVETSILVNAHRMESPWTELAVVFARAGGRPDNLGYSVAARIFRPPTPLEKALSDLEIWFESPSLRLIGEGGAYWPAFSRLARKGLVAGPVVHDARIAAICLENGVRTLFSADRDFSRFPGLKVINPLASR